MLLRPPRSSFTPSVTPEGRADGRSTDPAPTKAVKPTDRLIRTMSATLAQYLRTFSLWARHGFQERQPDSLANPGILLLAEDGRSVFRLSVTSAGALTVTPIPLGGGKP